MNKATRSRFLRFVLAGGGVLLLTLALTYLLTEVVKLYYLTSYVIVLTSTTVINFVLGSRFVFRTRARHGRRFFYYLLGLGIFYIGDILLTRLFTDTLGFHYTLSILFARGVVFVTKFLVYDTILFKDTSFLFENNK